MTGTPDIRILYPKAAVSESCHEPTDKSEFEFTFCRTGSDLAVCQ